MSREDAQADSGGRGRARLPQFGRPLYEPHPWRKMLVSTYISGLGISAHEIIELQEALDMAHRHWAINSRQKQYGCPFKVSELFAHDPSPRGERLSEKFNIRLSVIPPAPGKNEPNYRKARWRYDLNMARILNRRPVDFFFFSGSAEGLTTPFLQGFRGRILALNTGNLLKRDLKGELLYFGRYGVLKAMLAGETQTTVSVFVVGHKGGVGRLLHLTPPYNLEIPPQIEEVAADPAQRRDTAWLEQRAREIAANRVYFKEVWLAARRNTDNLIRYRGYPSLARTLMDLAWGNYGTNNQGELLYKGYRLFGHGEPYFGDEWHRVFLENNT